MEFAEIKAWSSFDTFIVGAGVWGCTLARRCAEAGKRVLVLEKRAAIGGNVRCETDAATGIEVHLYGSHIFHTHIPEVWAFVNRFTAFNGYQHKVVAKHDGRHYFLPLGLALVNKFFGVELAPSEVAVFLTDERRAAIFDAFFRNYTSKQWNKPPEEIDPTIIQRVPVRTNYDVNYFNDYWQGIPSDGYNAFFARLVDHPNIEVRCNAAFGLGDLKRVPRGVRVYYSGAIDALFGYRFGALPWRTLRFETERRKVADAQGTSVVNYVDADVPWTRQHEYKHYHPEWREVMEKGETIVCREFSATWKPGDEPYYPVNDAASAALLARYQAETAKIPNLVVGGRLGSYKYFDMDKSIDAALKVDIR